MLGGAALWIQRRRSPCERSSARCLYNRRLATGEEFGIETDGFNPPGI